MTLQLDAKHLDDNRRLKIAKISALVNNTLAASIANCLGGFLAFYVAMVVTDGVLPWVTLGLQLAASALEFVGSSLIKSDLGKSKIGDKFIRRYEWQLILQRGFFALGWGVYGFIYFDPANQQVTLLILACVLTFAVSASGYGGYNLVTLINGRFLSLGPVILAALLTLPPQWPIYILVSLIGMVLGFLIGLNVDRTFTRAFENRLKAERAAKALDEAKVELENTLSFGHRMIDVICHDLQQPLKALELYAHQLLNGDPVEGGVDRERLREGIGHSTDNVSRLVRQLSDAQRARGNQFEPQYSTFTVDELFSRLAFDFEPVAQKEKVDLSFIECSVLVEADQALLERILRNLIDNAIKYGARDRDNFSRVVVGARRKKDHVEIWVIDQGQGMSADQLNRVFDAYNQANSDQSGLGLGLFIAQRLADAMDLELSVSSKVGKGSRFALQVPKSN